MDSQHLQQEEPRHPSRLDPYKEIESPKEDYVCECGALVEIELDASYSCNEKQDWHCIDCHIKHTKKRD
jgi:hypothetical protein